MAFPLQAPACVLAGDVGVAARTAHIKEGEGRMTAEETRRFALDLAVRSSLISDEPHKVVERARAFYEFLCTPVSMEVAA